MIKVRLGLPVFQTLYRTVSASEMESLRNMTDLAETSVVAVVALAQRPGSCICTPRTIILLVQFIQFVYPYLSASMYKRSTWEVAPSQKEYL